MGTKELKELVGLGLSSGELIAALADGVQISDLGKAVEVARAAGPGLKDAGKALDEYLAMTDAAALDLENWVVAEFDIPDDKVEAAIEMALKVAIQLRDLVRLFVKKPAVVNPVG